MTAMMYVPRAFVAFALRVLCALCLLISFAHAADVPMLSGRVVDNAELLSADARERISAALKAHEDKTTNQIAVLTIPALGEDNIEQYAVRVFESWKLGKKDKDNGLLLVIVPKERKIRIEVGRGLEGTLPDVTASRMIRNVIAPNFKTNQFDKGVEEGVAAIISQLEGNASDNPDAKDGIKDTETASGFKAPDMSLGERILFGVFIFGIIGLFTVIGIMTPSMGWFLYFFLIPFWALFPIVVIGFKGAMTILGVYLVGFPAAKLLLPRTQWYKNKTRTTLADRRQRGRGFGGVNHSRDNWSSGGWSSGGGGGSSDSFSGGGGDSGGGGSSGDY